MEGEGSEGVGGRGGGGWKGRGWGPRPMCRSQLIPGTSPAIVIGISYLPWCHAHKFQYYLVAYYLWLIMLGWPSNIDVAEH